MKMHWPHRRRAAGFTLVEILVVIGIIVILVGVLVPMISRAMRQAKNTRTAADMGAIGLALEAFKADHGDYPRIGAANIGFALLGKNLYGPFGDGMKDPTNKDDQDPPAHDGSKTYGPGDVVQTDGAGGDIHYLCIAPTDQAPPNITYWVVCNPGPTGAPPFISMTDGADGPGIRVRDGGKKWGPYIQEGRFRLRGTAIIDGNDNPILYFPARIGPTNVNAIYLPAVVANPPATATDEVAKYDVFDNWQLFLRTGETDNRLPQWRVHAMLGDYSCNGVIDSNTSEAAVKDVPYILWAAGTDGLFGPTDITDGTGTGANSNYEKNRTAVGQCDDITNFK